MSPGSKRRFKRRKKWRADGGNNALSLVEIPDSMSGWIGGSFRRGGIRKGVGITLIMDDE